MQQKDILNHGCEYKKYAIYRVAQKEFNTYDQ